MVCSDERCGEIMRKCQENGSNRASDELGGNKMESSVKNRLPSNCCDENRVTAFCDNKCAHTNKGFYRALGVIYKCEDFKYCSDEEILDGLREQKVINIERTTEPDTGKEGDTYYLTFEKSEIPDCIFAGYERYEVHKAWHKVFIEEEKIEKKRKRKKRKKNNEVNKLKKEEKTLKKIMKRKNEESYEGKKKREKPKKKKKEKRTGKWNTEKEREAGKVKFKFNETLQFKFTWTAMNIEAGNVKVNPPEEVI